MPTEILQGARNSFGPQDVEVKAPSTVSTMGVEKQLVVPLKFNDLPAVALTDETVQTIKAKSLITRVTVAVPTTAFAGGTSYDIGTYKKSDGTAVDADGIFALLTTAVINAGKVFNPGTALAGAQVGFSVGADDVQIVAAAAGTFTAGETVITIFYVEQV